MRIIENFKNTPDKFFSNLKQKISNEDKKNLKLILIVSLITGIIDYFYLMINGFAGPDGINEGAYIYIGQLNERKSLRWFIPTLNDLIGKNVVMPSIIVILYSLMIGLSVFLLVKMTNITSRLGMTLMTAAMVCFPVVTRQYAYLFMALSYSFSFLMVILAAYLIRKRKVLAVIGGIAALTLMFGSYQAYIAAATTIVLIMFMYDMVNKRKFRSAALDIGIYAGCSVVAGGINMLLANWSLQLNDISAYDRVSSFSFEEIFSNLKYTLDYCYKWLQFVYSEKVLGRSLLYPVLIAIIFIVVIYYMVRLIKDKKIINAISLLVSVLIFPICINFCVILFPHNGLSMPMKYPYVMIIPLAFILIEYLPKEKVVANVCRWISGLVVLALVIGFSVTAISTEIGYKMIYDSIDAQAKMIISDVYNVEGYVPGQTRVLLAGRFDYDQLLQENGTLFALSEIESGPITWNTKQGITVGNSKYFLNYQGVNFGVVTIPEYDYITSTEEFENMPLWPAEGSVRCIDGIIVVKKTNELPPY